MVKNLSAIQETRVRSLDQERPPKEGNGNPLQYSCLGNPVDRGAGRLRSLWLQRVGHNLVVKQQLQCKIKAKKQPTKQKDQENSRILDTPFSSWKPHSPPHFKRFWGVRVTLFNWMFNPVSLDISSVTGAVTLFFFLKSHTASVEWKPSEEMALETHSLSLHLKLVALWEGGCSGRAETVGTGKV